jgi:6-pyruvoyltetrahydropterin/6-carboxytetrahydropterin synthase
MSVTIKGTPNEEGMVIDFLEVKKIVNDEIISKFDHAYLNDIFEQPSAENIARFIFEKLDALLVGPGRELYEVQVWETATSSAIFTREDL